MFMFLLFAVVTIWFLFAVVFPFIGRFFSAMKPTVEYNQNEKPSFGEQCGAWDYMERSEPNDY